jgi:hypothetical protein
MEGDVILDKSRMLRRRSGSFTFAGNQGGGILDKVGCYVISGLVWIGIGDEDRRRYAVPRF